MNEEVALLKQASKIIGKLLHYDSYALGDELAGRDFQRKKERAAKLKTEIDEMLDDEADLNG